MIMSTARCGGGAALEQRLTWYLEYAGLPISGNHDKAPVRDRRTGEPTGEWALTTEARAVRGAFRGVARLNYFSPRLDRTYQVRVLFTLPHHRVDGDNMLKALCDALFSSGRDHLILRYDIVRQIEPSISRTQVWIDEFPADWRPIPEWITEK